MYRRQNLAEDKDALDGLFYSHMVSWRMRHRLDAGAAKEKSSGHREAYLSTMTDQVIGMIESQMSWQTFNHHGGANVWRNYKSVSKQIDNKLNELIEAELKASGAAEHDALADKVDPSVFHGRVSALPLSGDVSPQDLRNAKEKFLSFTRKLNDIVVSFTEGGKVLTSLDLRRVALLVEVNLYDTYSFLKGSGIMSDDRDLNRARNWANRTDSAFVAVADRKFFESFSEAVVELSKDFNFVAATDRDPLETVENIGPAGHKIQTGEEEVKDGNRVKENGSTNDSRREGETTGNGSKGAEEGVVSVEAYDSTTDSANEDGTERDDDEFEEDDDFTPIECEQVMEEGVDPLDGEDNGGAEICAESVGKQE